MSARRSHPVFRIGAVGVAVWALLVGTTGCRERGGDGDDRGSRSARARTDRRRAPSASARDELLGSLGAADLHHDTLRSAAGLSTDALLRKMRPESIADLIMRENADDESQRDLLRRLFRALDEAGTPGQRLDALFRIYKEHPDSEVVGMARKRVMKAQGRAPWKVALAALSKEAEPGLLGILSDVAELEPAWKTTADEGSIQHKVTGVVLERLKARQTEKYAAPELKLGVAILAKHSTADQIERAFKLLKSEVRWNRLAVALAEAGRFRLARRYSVQPNLERMYETAKALYEPEQMLSKTITPWGEKRREQAMMRVSHLLASLLSYGCVSADPTHRRELEKTEALLRGRLERYIKELERRARELSKASKEEVERLFRSLELLDALADAAKLQVVLAQSHRCGDEKPRETPIETLTSKDGVDRSRP